MSSIRSLTEKYGSFFLGCANVAVCPYTLTLNAFANSRHPRSEDLIFGVAACVILSTVIPILPALTSITFAVAAFAATLALASMFLLYPIAILSDALNSGGSSHSLAM